MLTLPLLAAFAALYPISIAAPTAARNSSTRNDLLDGDCRPITLIHARGTTEPGNIGFTLGPSFVNALTSELGAKNLAVQGVDYDASIAGYLEGGSHEGIKQLAHLANYAVQKCPDTQIVLSGYSQGAQVVHHGAALLETNVTSRVYAVVLFGDPIFYQPIPEIPTVKVDTICFQNDIICDGMPMVRQAHLSYALTTGQAARFVADSVAVSDGGVAAWANIGALFVVGVSLSGRITGNGGIVQKAVHVLFALMPPVGDLTIAGDRAIPALATLLTGATFGVAAIWRVTGQSGFGLEGPGDDGTSAAPPSHGWILGLERILIESAAPNAAPTATSATDKMDLRLRLYNAHQELIDTVSWHLRSASQPSSVHYTKHGDISLGLGLIPKTELCARPDRSQFPAFALAAALAQTMAPANQRIINLLGLHVLAKTVLFYPACLVATPLPRQMLRMLATGSVINVLYCTAFGAR